MTIERRREAASAIARFLEVLLNQAVTQEPTIVIETSFEPNPGPLWPAAGEAPWSQLRTAVADMLGHGVVVSGIFPVTGGPGQALRDLVEFAASNMKLAPVAAPAAGRVAEAWATQLALAGDAVFAYRVEVEEPDYYEYGLSWCDRLIVGNSGLLTVHTGLRD